MFLKLKILSASWQGERYINLHSIGAFWHDGNKYWIEVYDRSYVYEVDKGSFLLLSGRCD